MEPGYVAAGAVGALAPSPGGRGWAIDDLGPDVAGVLKRGVHCLNLAHSCPSRLDPSGECEGGADTKKTDSCERRWEVLG